MTDQRFIILGIPKAQGRLRHRVQFARSGKPYSQGYMPEEDVREANNTRAQLVQQSPVRCDGAVDVVVLFVLPRPQDHYGVHGLRPSAPLDHIKVPDIDNLTKHLFDACRGVLWIDDRQVCHKDVGKEYGDQPRTEIVVKDIGRRTVGVREVAREIEGQAKGLFEAAAP